MKNTELFLNKNVKNSLINKFFYKDINQIPKIKKVVLNLIFKSNDMKELSTGLLALKILTNKKGTLIAAKKANITLKIRKGQPIGCKVELSLKKFLGFLEKNLYELISKNNKNQKNFYSSVKYNNSVSITIKEFIFLEDLEKHYQIFNKLKHLNINISINKSYKKETNFLFNSLKIIKN
jgi:large subunit ribosomal protein L5